MILRFDDELRVVMEATGVYHLPVLNYLQNKNIFVSVINPFEMKQYRCKGLRKVKTDKQDSIEISKFRLDTWYHLINYESSSSIYEELKLLRRQYCHYMSTRIESTKILTQMQELAKKLPEYPVVRAMGGVGNVQAPKLIAEISDIRRFHSSKALVAYAGIDAPPFQSGKFIGTERKISKRGSSNLRKIGYEVMRCLKSHNSSDDPAVLNFIIKKELEGKHKRAAKIVLPLLTRFFAFFKYIFMILS